MPSHSYIFILLRAHLHTVTCTHKHMLTLLTHPHTLMPTRARESLLKHRGARFPHGRVKGWQEPSSVFPNPSSLFEVLLTKYPLCYKGKKGNEVEGKTQTAVSRTQCYLQEKAGSCRVGCGVGVYVFSIFNHWKSVTWWLCTVVYSNFIKENSIYYWIKGKTPLPLRDHTLPC